MLRTYEEEFFRKAVMLPSSRKGGLELIVFSVISVLGIAVYFLLKLLFKGIKRLFEKCKEQQANKEVLEKFKNDISVTNYNIFYELIEGKWDEKTQQLNQKVNFIAYDSEKQDICNVDKRIFSLLNFLGYNGLRMVKGNNKVKCKEYVFVTETELDTLKRIIGTAIGKEVNFLPY